MVLLLCSYAIYCTASGNKQGRIHNVILNDKLSTQYDPNKSFYFRYNVDIRCWKSILEEKIKRLSWNCSKHLWWHIALPVSPSTNHDSQCYFFATEKDLSESPSWHHRKSLVIGSAHEGTIGERGVAHAKQLGGLQWIEMPADPHTEYSFGFQ